MRIKWNIEKVQSYCLEHGSKFLSKSFGKVKDKYEFLCTECKEETVVKTFDSYKVKNSAVCEHCFGTINWDINKVKKYVEKNNSKFLSDEFHTTHDKYLFQCSNCKKPFETTFSKFKHRNKVRCNKCNDYYILDYKDVKNEIEMYGNTLITKNKEYINVHQKLGIKCSECGSVFHRSYTEQLNYKYHSCKKCSMSKASESRRHTNTYVSEYIRNNNAELLSIYTNSNENLKIRCSCGDVFYTSFSRFKNGKNRCNKCTSYMSNGEKRFMDFLKDYNIEFEQQYTFDECRNILPLPFDFYLPEYDICVEIDGVLHRKFYKHFHKTLDNFKQRQYRDNIKDKFCESNNIKLHRVVYNKIEDISNWWNENAKEVFSIG